MAELPQFYDVTYRDEAGSVILEQQFHRYPFAGENVEGEEREVRFLEAAHALGAATYDVRLRRSNEVRNQMRQIRREEFANRVTRQMAHITGVDRMIKLLPVMAEMEQPNMADAHFARS